jgi:hypothetical protein
MSIDIDCPCGESIEFDEYVDPLYNEDYTPIEIKCTCCGAEYKLCIHIEFVKNGDANKKLDHVVDPDDCKREDRKNVVFKLVDYLAKIPMKATLQIDTPKSCAECKLGEKYGAVGDVRCFVLGEYFTGNIKPPHKERPDTCPLVIEKKGLRWIDTSNKHFDLMTCPKCKGEYEMFNYNYCPSCGVKLAPPLEGDDG